MRQQHICDGCQQHDHKQDKCLRSGFLLTKTLFWFRFLDRPDWVTLRPLLCPREVLMTWMTKHTETEKLSAVTSDAPTYGKKRRGTKLLNYSLDVEQ